MALQAKRSVYKRYHQVDKPKPKYKLQKYNRTQRMLRRMDKKIKGRPSKVKRSQFSVETKQKIIMIHGSTCFTCNSPFIEFHHVKFKSKNGRGTYRNGLPLCRDCHELAHTPTPEGLAYAQALQKYIISMFGKYYYMDEYDLYNLGLISSPTIELYDRFMKRQEEVAQAHVS